MFVTVGYVMKGSPPRTFTMKQRIGLLLWVIFFIIPLLIAFLWMGIDTMSDYLSFPSSLVYSLGGVILLFSPILLIPLIVLTIPPVFIGKQMVSKNALLLLKFMVYGCVCAIISATLFSFIYLSELEKRGYLPCRGIPTGYMPGMGKRYVTDLSLCKNRSG